MKKKNHKIEVYPSILSANIDDIVNECQKVMLAGASGIHIDIMDGIYVENKSFDINIINKLKHLNIPLDVHLMVQNPLKLIKDISGFGADSITFHTDSESNILDLISLCAECNLKLGIAIKVDDNNIRIIEDYISYIDIILIMTVPIGFSGQSFSKDSFEKIKRVKALVDKLKPNTTISVDGGVNASNSSEIIKCGASRIVAGNSIFKSEDYISAIKYLT